MASKHEVASAWARGKFKSASNLMTDGQQVLSYGHVIATTMEDGTKVAFDCHASRTTAGHANAMKDMASKVVGCMSCGTQIKKPRKKNRMPLVSAPLPEKPRDGVTAHKMKE